MITTHTKQNKTKQCNTNLSITTIICANITTLCLETVHTLISIQVTKHNSHQWIKREEKKSERERRKKKRGKRFAFHTQLKTSQFFFLWSLAVWQILRKYRNGNGEKRKNTHNSHSQILALLTVKKEAGKTSTVKTCLTTNLTILILNAVLWCVCLRN